MKHTTLKEQNNFTSTRQAFTMIELVFVIVVLGILTAMALPRLDRDLRQEAADNVLSAIRYTQHMALTDDRHENNNTKWIKTLWTIRFDDVDDDNTTQRYAYKIGSNRDYSTNIDKSETALDPSNGKRFYASLGTLQIDESPNVLIGQKYGVNKVDFSGCKTLTNNRTNTSSHIAFDHLGRPHKGVFNNALNVSDYSTLMTGTCTITFGFNNTSIEDFSIIIEPETGYAYIRGQTDS